MPSDHEVLYDVALSYAGEQRAYVEQVAGRLTHAGLRVSATDTSKHSCGASTSLPISAVCTTNGRDTSCCSYLPTTRMLWISVDHRPCLGHHELAGAERNQQAVGQVGVGLVDQHDGVARRPAGVAGLARVHHQLAVFVRPAAAARGLGCQRPPQHTRLHVTEVVAELARLSVGQAAHAVVRTTAGPVAACGRSPLPRSTATRADGPRTGRATTRQSRVPHATAAAAQ